MNYIDYVYFSDYWVVHVGHIKIVLKELRTAGLTVKRNKCSCEKKYISYRGHRVGCGQLAVPDHRVSAMRDY